MEPVKVKDLPAFLRAIEPIMRELSRGDVMAALATQADAVIEATAIGAGIPRAELEESTVDVLVDLASRVIEVNADFFVQRVLPAIAAAADRINAISAISHPSSTIGSSDSAAQASGTPT